MPTQDTRHARLLYGQPDLPERTGRFRPCDRRRRA